MARIEFAGVSAGYRESTVLEPLDLVIEPGMRVGLIGPNGSGKTTLLRVVAGVLPTRTGRVLLGSVDVAAMSREAIARAVAFVPQEETWEFPFTVEGVVACGRYAHASSVLGESEEDKAAVTRAIAAVGLQELRSRPITELSGGERRRAILARSLAQSAPALLLDEPTTALDLRHRQAVLRVLAKTGGTLVMATHDLDAAAAYCERLIALDYGRVVADGPPRDVITEEFLADVFGVRAEVRMEGDRLHVIPEF
ncbi:MAG: ABC transporter ATP-binding protein [Planctomycetota bacterium]